MNHQHIGRRVRALRDANRMTQADLAIVLGLKDRQSVAAIEAGERRLKADELIAAVGHFKVTLAEITNPFLLFEKESFSWRQKHVPLEQLDAFEARAGEWIGAYRELSQLGDIRLKSLLPRLGLTHHSSFEEAVEVGESVAAELDLGERPAKHLVDVISEKLGVLVLMVDTIPGISGAACRLPELNAILINRHETPARRNADLAHELFHILTWDTMKPQRVESSDEPWEQPRTQRAQRAQRIENLADNFASGLLMPSAVLDAMPQPKPEVDLAEWLTAAAAELEVSSHSLRWRLANSGRMPAAARVPREALNGRARLQVLPEPPPAFSRHFMEALVHGIERGHLSTRRAAELIDETVEDLWDLCEAHGVDCLREI